MKLSWTSIRISIAGARLSHLVQKDKIWDPGSMTEQARMIFYLVQKAKANGNMDSIRRQCSESCYERLKAGNDTGSSSSISPVVKEVAIIAVQPGKNNRPDMFSALIKGISNGRPEEEFKARCLFVRQGDWWVLDKTNW